MTNGEPLLSVRGLEKHYPVTAGVLSKEIGRVRAVDGISFDLARGETLGLVGESGCGKSTAATSIIRLEKPTGGEVLFNSANQEFAKGGGRDVTAFDDERLKRFRRQAQIIFQDPSSSFDPRMTIGESVGEPLRVHGIDRDRRKPIVQDLLERVGLSGDDYYRYPHEFSGGQKQRIALARALVLNPELIVADEPVSALDVSIQAEILSLINEIQEEFGLSMLFISHDMRVIQQVADRVAVMYLGEIVEIGPTEELFSNPQHPYTRALLSSIPYPDPSRRAEGVELSGDVPSPSNPPSGCRFHTRCPEIIPPTGHDIEQSEWRSVTDLLVRLEKGSIDRETIGDLAVAEKDVSPEEVTDEIVENMLRESLELPDPLSDPDVESVVADVIQHVVDDEPDKGFEVLEESFPTPCRTTEPADIDIATDQRVACHLHDETVTADAGGLQAPTQQD